MSLSLSSAWDEASGVLKRDGWRIFAIALLSISLPAAILQAIAPVTAPGTIPEAGLWLLLAPVVLAASLLGALAICRLALGHDAGAGAALAGGLSGFLPLLGAALPLGLAAALLIAAGLLLAAALGSPLPALASLAVLGFFWVRLILLTPIAAAEPVGAVGLIGRGWALTAGNFWRLLIFPVAAAILSLASLIAAGAMGGVAAGLAGGQPQPGILALALVLLVSASLQAAVTGGFTVFLARAYAQLALE